MNTNEADVYIMRKTSLDRTEIGKLTPAEYNTLLRELYYQESVDQYRAQHSIASILAAIYNTIPRKRGSKQFKANDFLKGEMPQRNQKQDALDEIADKRGVKLPTKELKER